MSDGLRTLIERLDAAVRLREPDLITQRIKSELEDAIRAGTIAYHE